MAGKKKNCKRGRSGSNGEKSPSQSQSIKKPKPSHLFDNLGNASDNDSVYLDADGEISDVEITVDDLENSEIDKQKVSTSKMAAMATVNKSDLVEALKEALRDPDVVKLINDSMRTETESLKEVIVEKDQKINELEDKLEGLEMYGRRNGVRIHGIPEKEGERTDEIVINLAKRIGAEIPSFALGRSHRVGPKNTGRTSPIIAKFIGHNFKVEMLRNKKNLKKHANYKDVYINEDLTSKRAKWAQRARDLVKTDKIQATRSRDGIIFIKHKDKDKDTPGKVDRVSCEEELQTIEKMYSLILTIHKSVITE